MDPTNLLLILAMGSPHCQTRHIAQHHLEKQGMSAMVTLVTFERSKDPEVVYACRRIKERLTSKFILDWAASKQFVAMGKGKIEGNYDYHYIELAENSEFPGTENSPLHQARHATRLMAIDLLLAGRYSWKTVYDEFIGNDELTDENFYRQ